MRETTADKFCYFFQGWQEFSIKRKGNLGGGDIQQS